MPEAERPVAGTRAALEMLSRPDVRPTFGHVAENGALLVRWELRGLRDRQVYRCDYPVVLTWARRSGWGPGVRHRAVHAWLLADGERGIESTRTGFVLGESTCSGRDRTDQAPALVVDEQGRLRNVRMSDVTAPPRDGAIAWSCPPPDRGPCQLDPETRTIRRLPSRFSWVGTWHPETSLLSQPTTAISGSWSVDGGVSWSTFVDGWNAAPLRLGDTLFAVTDSVRPSLGELPAEVDLRSNTERGPDDLTSVVPLPKSEDGYRSWETTPDGTLVGIGRSGVYVSEGTNWYRVTRRDAGRCRWVEVVGRLLVCGPMRTEQGKPEVLEMRVSDDLGRSWSGAILNEVVPRTEAKRP